VAWADDGAEGHVRFKSREGAAAALAALQAEGAAAPPLDSNGAGPAAADAEMGETDAVAEAGEAGGAAEAGAKRARDGDSSAEEPAAKRPAGGGEAGAEAGGEAGGEAGAAWAMLSDAEV